MKKVKVLMLTSSYPLGENISGPFIKTIAEGLVQKGIDVKVMMFSAAGKYKKKKDEGITVIEYPYSLLLPPALHKHRGLIPSIKNSMYAKIELPLYLIHTFYYLNKIPKKDYDVVHAHWYVPSGFIAALAKGLTKKPLITTAWGAEFHLPKNTIIKKILNFVNRRSDVKVTVSEYMKSKAKDYKIDMKDIIIIPNAVNTKDFTAEKRKHEKIIIATMRRFVPEKRIQDIIKAISLLPMNIKSKIKVWLIGDGPEKERLVKLTNDLELNNIITFLGMVPHEDIASLLQEIDIYVNPSIQEGMATANLEAMAAGVCPVATQGVGNDEVIANGQTGFLYPPKDVSCLADILKRLISNKELRIECAKRSVKVIKNNFSQQKVTDLYIKEYQSLINL
ncbi:MAG: glycosyltransferase family 4 protein [Candidatus Pacebacteria bacterium]|nr:glycosyltransferase family 4 protein [Candidatus Paceibacterota bacterium]